MAKDTRNLKETSYPKEAEAAVNAASDREDDDKINDGHGGKEVANKATGGRVFVAVVGGNELKDIINNEDEGTDDVDEMEGPEAFIVEN